jgi:hypothetical protein
VVSIISAGQDGDGLRVSWGMELPGLVEALKAGLRSGRATSAALETAPQRGGVGKRVTPGSASDTGARFVKP